MDEKAEMNERWASGYMSTLTPTLLQELGEINLDWFDDLTEEPKLEIDSREKQKMYNECYVEKSKVTVSTDKCLNQISSEAVGIEQRRCEIKRIAEIRSQPYAASSPRVPLVAENYSRNPSTPIISDVKSPSTPGTAGNTPTSSVSAIRWIDKHSTPNYGQQEISRTAIKREHDSESGKMEKQQQLSTPVFSPWVHKNDDRTSIAQFDHLEDLEQLLDRVLDSESLNNINTNPLQQSITDSETLTETCESVTSTSEQTQPPAVASKGLSKLLMLKTPVSLVSRSGRDKDIQRMLGVNSNESGMSWTSSLATPTSTDVHRMIGSGLNNVPQGAEQEFTVGAARKLFSPGTNFSDMEETALDTTAEDDFPLQSPIFKANDKETKVEAIPQTGPYAIIATETMNSSINSQHKKILEKFPNQELDLASEGAHSRSTAKCKPTNVSSKVVHENREKYKKPLGTPEQSVSLNLLGDLFDTPPSRSSLRKPPPKKRMLRKRHFSPCVIEGKLCEDPLVAKPCENVLQLSPMGGTVQNLSMGFVPGLSENDLNGSTSCEIDRKANAVPSLTVETDSKSKISLPDQSGDLDSRQVGEVRDKDIKSNCDKECRQNDEQEKPDKVNSDDMFFTQISQSALNAIYIEVDETEEILKCEASISDKKDHQKNTELGVKEIVNMQPKMEAEDNMCKKTEVLQIKTEAEDKTRKNSDSDSVRKQETADDVFTQMSPGVLKSIMSETDQVEKLNVCILPEPVSCKPKSEIENKVSTTNQGKIEFSTPKIETPSPNRGKIKSHTPTMKQINSPSLAKPVPTMAAKQTSLAKSIGYSRKVKRFSYPTTNQISNVCPKKIFGFKTETLRNTGLKGDMDILGTGDHPTEIPDEKTVEKVSSVPSSVQPETKPAYNRRKHDFGFTPLSAYKENVQAGIPGPPSGTHLGQRVQTQVINQKCTSPYTKGPENTQAPENIYDKPVLQTSDIYNKDLTDVCNLKTHSGRLRESTNSTGQLLERNNNAFTVAAQTSGTKMEKQIPKDSSSSLTHLPDDETKRTNKVSSAKTRSNTIDEDMLDPVRRYELEKWFAEDMDLDGLTQHDIKPKAFDKSAVKEEKQSKEEDLSMERSTTNGDVMGTVGFKTAAGKQIAVSTKDTAKFASWFEEDFMEHEATTKPPNKPISDSPDMKTSSGKEIDVYSKESGNHPVGGKEPVKLTLKEENASEAVLPSCGFQRAGGKKIDVSTKDTAKFETWFEEDPVKQRKTINSGSENTIMTHGFHTAGGREIEVSMKNAKEYAKWFEEDPAKPQNLDIEYGNKTPSTTVEMKMLDETEKTPVETKLNVKEKSDVSATACGFQTADGKKITVSAEETPKFATWLEEDPSKDIVKNEVTGGGQFMSSGFKTAGGKKIDISTIDTDKYSSWFEDTSESTKGKELMCCNVPKAAGSKTAGGKKIDVSTEEVAKYASWYEEDPSVSKVKVKALGENPPEAVGFKTAGGKKIDISTKDVEKYASLFEEASKINMKSPNEILKIDTGFKTAGGKKIEVPTKDMAKYTNWLEEESEHKTNGMPVASVDFQTAAGKQINVSTKDNAKFESWFEDDKTANLTANKNKENTSFTNIGFQTAPGKDLSVDMKDKAKFESWFDEAPSENRMKEGSNEDPRINPTGCKGPTVCKDPAIIPSGEKSTELKQMVNDAGINNGKLNDEMSDDQFDTFLKGLKKVAVTKQEKDYSKLPKGFRPFKRPRMIGKPKEKELDKKDLPHKETHKELSKSVIINQEKRKQTDQPSVDKAEAVQQVSEICKVSELSNLANPKEPEDTHMASLDDSFDNLPYTQITEMTDCAAAFLANEADTSFTQCQTQDKQSSKLHSPDSVVSSTSGVNEKNEKQIEPSQQNAEISDGNMDISRSGVNSVIPPISENQTIPGQSNSNSDKPRYALGFETAGGKTVSVSDELLQQVREQRTNEEQDEEDQGSPVLLRGEAKSAGNNRLTPDLQTVPVPCSDGRDSLQVDGGTSDLPGRLPSPIQLSEAGTSDSLFQKSCQKGDSSISLYSGQSSLSRSSKRQSSDAVVPNAMGTKYVSNTSTSLLQCKMKPSSSQAMSVFATASGRAISVSTEHLRKAKNLLHEDENSPQKKKDHNELALVPHVEKRREDTLPQAHSCEETVGLAGKFVGFSTAGGKAVVISEKALSHVQHLFEDPSDTNDTPLRESVKVPERVNAGSSAEFHINEDTYHTVESKKINRFEGFQTARGTVASISREAFDKAKNLLDFEEEPKSKPSLQEKSPSAPFIGFETAGGAKVTISETALIQAEHILKEDEIGNAAQCSKEIPRPAPFLGFETAGGSKIKVSEAALKQVRNIFTEGLSISGNTDGKSCLESCIAEKGEKPSLMCFQTAKGSKVTVSETALKKVKDLYGAQRKNDDRDAGNKECPIKASFNGFETARGSKVAVSETALQHVQGINQNEQSEKVQTKPPIFAGFETASGSKVNVSGDAIKQARELLKDTVSGAASCTQAPPQGEQLCDEGKHKDIHDSNKNLAAHETNKAAGNTAENGSEQLMTELSESSKAFLTDGAMESLDEEIEFNYKKGPPKLTTLTPDVARGKFKKAETHQRKGDRRRLSTKPVASTPEAFISDRCALRQSLTHNPLISAPEKEVQTLEGQRRGVSFRWNGPTSYKAFASGSSSHSDIEQNLNNASVVNATPQKQPNKPESSFVTPYRKQNQNQANFTTPVKAPTSQTVSAKDHTPSGTFKTPVKTLAKRTVSEAEFTTPTNKKSKVESSSVQEHPETKVGIDSEINAEDLLGDWDEDQEDSLDSALALAELEKVEASTCSARGSEIQPQRIRVSGEVVKLRTKAKVEQAKRIQKKREVGGVRPQAGCWYKERCVSKGFPLRTAVGGWTPRTYSKQQLHAFGVRESTLQVKAACAENFRFLARDFYGENVTQESTTVRVGDGALVVWDEFSTAGKEEFCNALLDMEGVDPKLTDHDWVYNHYRWIVWKLAAMEAAFPQVFGGRKLTPDQVMLQLKYRYDREVDNSQRSAIKKIFERDDTPAKAMILCVSAIVSLPGQGVNKPETQSSGDANKDKSLPKETAVLELTDGWYPIKAVVDPALTRIVVAGRLQPGAKLCIYGAELVGSQEAAPPLQAPADVMLKVSANSCRRARWDARLGFNRNPQAPALPLCSLYRDGGQVCCVDVIIARVYPIQYMERTLGGGTVFRSARADQKVARRDEDERQKQMEKIYTKLQAEFEKRAAGTDRRRSRRSGRHFTMSEIQSLSTGQDIEEAAQAASDPGSVEDVLSAHQMGLLTEYRRTQQEEVHREMQAEFAAQVELLEEQKPKRNVVPLLKIRVAGCSTSDIDSKTDCMLTIWRPSDDVIETLGEGKRFKVFNLGAAEARGRMSRGSVSLTAQRSTRYQLVPVDTNFLDVIYEPREVSMLTELCAQFQPQYGEVDTVGVVVHITPTSSFDRAGGDEGHVQTVYIADSERHLVAITVWGSVATFGLEEVLKPSSLVAFGNLQWRPNSRTQAGHLPSLTLSEATLVSTNPKESHLRSALEQLKAKIKAVQVYVSKMKEQLHGHITTPRRTDSTPQGVGQRGPVSRTPLTTLSFIHQRHPRTPQYPHPGASTPTVSLGGQGDAPLPTVVNPEPMKAVSSGADGSMEVTPYRTGQEQSDGDLGMIKTWTPIEAPGSACGEVDIDPVVTKKRALQRLKAKRLSMYADDTPVTPLNSSVSTKARSAFKMPSSVSHSASPALQQNLAQKGHSTNKMKMAITETDSDNEKLGRKLSFEEEVEVEPKAISDSKQPEIETSVSCAEPNTKAVSRTHSRSSLSLGKKGQQQKQVIEIDCDDTIPAVINEDDEKAITLKSDFDSKSSTLDRSSKGGHSECHETDACNNDNAQSLESDSEKSKRGRGRVKRQLSDNGEEQRQTKRQASLGPSRRKSKK